MKDANEFSFQNRKHRKFTAKMWNEKRNQNRQLLLNKKQKKNPHK